MAETTGGEGQMSLITKTINHLEYMLFEGGYTKEEAKKRVQQLKASVRNKPSHNSARTVPYEGQYAVFIGIRRNQNREGK